MSYLSSVRHLKEKKRKEKKRKEKKRYIVIVTVMFIHESEY